MVTWISTRGGSVEVMSVVNGDMSLHARVLFFWGSLSIFFICVHVLLSCYITLVMLVTVLQYGLGSVLVRYGRKKLNVFDKPEAPPPLKNNLRIVLWRKR